MSLITHTFLPRSAFDMDWLRVDPSLGLNTLDIFDPFDELDRTLGRNLMWLDVPETLRAALTLPQQPRVPRKYRIQVKCEGFSPRSIKTEVSADKQQLIVYAKEGAAPTGDSQDNYTLREFRRTYKLPENAATEQLVSFMTSDKRLIIEMPIEEEEEKQQAEPEQAREDLIPRIVASEEGGDQKRVEMDMVLPASIDPANIKVTCKDRDVIVQGESKDDKAAADQQSRVFYYRRTTLPENVDLSELKCTFDNNRLSIRAPLNASLEQAARTVPVEFKQKQPEQLPESGEQAQISGEQQQEQPLQQTPLQQESSQPKEQPEQEEKPLEPEQSQAQEKPPQSEIPADEADKTLGGQDEKSQKQQQQDTIEGKQDEKLFSSKVQTWSQEDTPREVGQ